MMQPPNKRYRSYALRTPKITTSTTVLSWWILLVVILLSKTRTDGFGIPTPATIMHGTTIIRSSSMVLWSMTREKVEEEGTARTTTTTTTLPVPTGPVLDPVPPKPEPKPELPIGALIQRALDTVEDVYLHLKRLPYEYGWWQQPQQQDGGEMMTFDERETIVVLGTGWAAHALLKTIDTYKARVIVVSPINHFVFTPLLASAAVGTVEYRSLTESVRTCNPLIFNYLEGRAIDIDVQAKTLKVQMEELLQDLREGVAPLVDLPYDRLVVAVGCKTADSIVPGAREYALRLKTCDDARRLRTAVGECLEFACRPCVKDDPNFSFLEREIRREARKKRLTIAIVGGGPTGVELVGELADFMKDITRPRTGAYPDLRNEVNLVLLHGDTELVPQFDPDLREHAKQSLIKAGVDVRLNVLVNEVGDGFVKFTPKGAGQVQETLDVGLAVFAAGTEAVPFVKKLLQQLPPEAKGAQGKIKVDGWLRCPIPDDAEFGSILVMGDAASLTDGVNNSYLPQTAQVAGQQGAFAARLLNRGYNLTTPVPQLLPGADFYLKLRGLDEASPFTFLNLGILAYVGGGEALTQVQLGDVPLFSYAGSVSFMLWRSVYLVKQVATRNRLLLLFDWMKTKVFGRDITRL